MSLGVHSYNDSRRTYINAADYTSDKLDIQGGKHLKLNVGYWQDELDGGSAPPEEDRVEGISFWVNDGEKMRLRKNQLTITEAVSINPSLTVTGNLTVTGKSHLQDVVSIGAEAPDQTIGLKVKRDLSVSAGSAGEVVGLKLDPTLTANNNDDRLIGLHVAPQFNVIGEQTGVKKYGLIVERGKVGIGKSTLLEKQEAVDSGSGTGKIVKGLDVQPYVKAQNDDKVIGLYIKPEFDNQGQDPERYGLVVEEGKVSIGEGHKQYQHKTEKIRMGVDMRPHVSARSDDNLLVGLFISPFLDNGKQKVAEEDKYGLIVEGKVAIGQHKTSMDSSVSVVVPSEYPVELDSKTSKVRNLTVTGDLEVYGQVTQHADKDAAGDIYLGKQNEDDVIVHASLSTAHTSGKLKVISPLEIGLASVTDVDKQDFLSLFSTNKNETKGRIIWKKGDVTAHSDSSYAEQAKEVAAIYSTTSGDGSDSSIGDLRFGTSEGNEDIQDRMIITADGKVGIGSNNPGKNQLKVTGTTDLNILTVDDTTVNTNLTVGGNNAKLIVSSSNSSMAQPNLKVTQGHVCIGADSITRLSSGSSTGYPGADQSGYDDDTKLYVKGGYVSFDAGLNVQQNTILGEDLTVRDGKVMIGSNLTATGDGQTLTAVKIEPTLSEDRFSNVKKLGLHVVRENVVLCSASGGVAIGSEDPGPNKLKVTGGNTLLEGNLEVSQAQNIALKVNQATQEVGIGGDYAQSYKLAVAGNTKITGKLELVPSLNGTSDAVQINPTLRANKANQTLTAVKIEPTFSGGSVGSAKKLGLHVVRENVVLCSASGGVAIGSDNPAGHKLKVTGGTTLLEGTLTASANNQILTAVKIAPTFNDSSLTGVKKLGLHVETGDTQLNGDLTVSGKVAIGSAAVDGSHKLKVTGGTTLLEDTLTVSGASSNLIVASGKVAIGSTTVDASHKLKVTGGSTTDTLTVTGASTLSSLTTSGNATIGETLTVAGASTLSSLTTSGNATIGGTLTVSGNITINNLEVPGNVAIGDKTAMEQSGLNCPLYVYKYDATKNSNLVEMARFERGCDDAEDNIAEAEGGYIGLYLTDNNTLHKEVSRISWRYDNEGNRENEGRLGFWTSSNDSGLVERLTIRKNGAVGIGNKNPDNTVLLDVNGKIRSTQSTLETSDVKLKENIQTIKDGLGKILGLRGVTYQRKDNKEVPQEATEIGLVAQEVEEFFPELVSTDSEGTKSLSYSRLIAPLIEAVKDQQGQILGLVQQIQQQQTQIEQLQALNG